MPPIEDFRVGGQSVSNGGGGGPHTHTADDLPDLPDLTGNLPQSRIAGLPSVLSAKADSAAVQAALDAKAAVGHGHQQSEVAGLETALSAKLEAPALTPLQTRAEKGAANGYAGLDSGGKVPANQLPPAGGGTLFGLQIILQHPRWPASTAATNLALNAWNPVNDLDFRQVVDLRGMTKLRLHGKIGGTLVAATKIRVRYHLGGNITVATADAGWLVLCDSAGGHAANTHFFSAELAIPAGAQVSPVVLQPGLFSGDGVADPTLLGCVLLCYP